MIPSAPGADTPCATPAARPLRVAVLGACGAGAATLTQALADQRPAWQAGNTPALLEALHHSARPGAVAAALQALGACDLILLLGLAPLASGAVAAQVCEEIDRQLRAALQGAGLAYRVLYGNAAEQLRHALDAIDSVAKNPYPKSTLPQYGSPTAVWSHSACEKCSDPDCERRLFTGLRG